MSSQNRQKEPFSFCLGRSKEVVSCSSPRLLPSSPQTHLGCQAAQPWFRLSELFAVWETFEQQIDSSSEQRGAREPFRPTTRRLCSTFFNPLKSHLGSQVPQIMPLTVVHSLTHKEWACGILCLSGKFSECRGARRIKL